MYLNRRARRDFLGWAAKFSLLAIFGGARADPRLETGTLEYGGIRCYVARPTDDGEKVPALLVIDERRNPYLAGLARRAALEGFNAIAPDITAPADREDALTALLAVVDDVASRHASRRIGVIGFGWGGGMANQLAVRSARVAAVASFYGAAPDLVDVPRIKARLLLHYAERDMGINTRVPAYEGALKAAGIQHAIHMYPGTDPAFHDETAGTRYNRDAAGLAWRRTMDFFKDALR